MDAGDDIKDGDDIDHREIGDLLKLFTSLGVTVAVGIVGFFLLGIWADRHLAAMGVPTRGLVRIAGLLLGVCLTVYWAYLRIARHLDKYENQSGPRQPASGNKHPPENCAKTDAP